MNQQRFQCPRCGALLEVHLVNSGNGRWRSTVWRPFAAGEIAPVPSWAELTRREPAREPGKWDIMTPAAWAGLTGVAIGLLVAPIAVMAHWPWWIVPASSSAGAGLAWFVLIPRWHQLLWRVEEIVGADLDEDDQVGHPTRPRNIRVEIVEQGRQHHRIRFVDLPPTIEDSHLEQIAHAVMPRPEGEGRPFSRRSLQGIISPEQYRDLKEALLGAGLVTLAGRSERAGIVLTGAGRAFLRQFL